MRGLSPTGCTAAVNQPPQFFRDIALAGFGSASQPIGDKSPRYNFLRQPAISASPAVLASPAKSDQISCVFPACLHAYLALAAVSLCAFSQRIRVFIAPSVFWLRCSGFYHCSGRKGPAYTRANTETPSRLGTIKPSQTKTLCCLHMICPCMNSTGTTTSWEVFLVGRCDWPTFM